MSGRRERLAHIPYGFLHPALLIAPGDSNGTGLEAIVAREVEQGGMKADGVAVAFQHGTLQIVVE